MKYIFLDVDGTIIDHAHACIPESTQKCLKELKKNNQLFICSGRAYRSAKIENGIDYDGYICSLGADVYYRGRNIIDRPFTSYEFEKISEMARKYQIELTFECRDHGYSAPLLYDRVYHSTNLFQDSSYIYWIKKEEYKGEKIYKMMCETNLDNIENHYRFRRELFEYFDFCLSPINTIASCEASPKGYSKGSAIEMMAGLGYIKMEDTIAIGDSMNDIMMLEKARIGIAMGQASDEVKRYADIMTDPVDRDGFYKAFKKLGLVS